MINDRDTYIDFNTSTERIISVPYNVGTIMELRNNSKVLARICEYRIRSVHGKRVINVALTSDIYEENPKIKNVIDIKELLQNWKKTDKILINNDPKYSIGLVNMPKIKVKKIKFN